MIINSAFQMHDSHATSLDGDSINRFRLMYHRIYFRTYDFIVSRKRVKRELCINNQLQVVIKHILTIISILFSCIYQLHAQSNFDKTNQLREIKSESCSTISFAYDELGNITSKSIKVFKAPNVLTEVLSACENESFQIETATTNGTVYWYEDTEATQHVHTGDIYDLVLSANKTYYIASVDGDCISRRVPVNLTTYPNPETPSLQEVNGVIISQMSAATFTWYLDGVALDIQDGFLVPEQSGEYVLEVSNEYGCKAQSEPLTVELITGLSTLPEESIQVYPNPTRDNLYITFSQQSQEYTISLHSLDGQELRRETTTGQQTINWQTTNLPTGTYLLHVSSEEGFLVKKIVVE